MSEIINNSSDRKHLLKHLIERLHSGQTFESVQANFAKEFGNVDVREIAALLNTLPFDITFVDANDEVAYFSQSKERIFTRATAIIGRKVVNCHVVRKILDGFKSGKRDMAECYIHQKEKYVYIR